MVETGEKRKRIPTSRNGSSASHLSGSPGTGDNDVASEHSDRSSKNKKSCVEVKALHFFLLARLKRIYRTKHPHVNHLLDFGCREKKTCAGRSS